MRHFCQDWFADVTIFLAYLCEYCTFLTLRCVHFKKHISPKLWSWKIVALSPGMYFIFENIYCRMRRTFIRHIYLGISPRRADKNFFFIRTWCRSRTSASTERQKGVRDRHENDPRRVHPLADLCYHMVLRYHQLEREIDVENISPFNISLFAPSTPPLIHSLLSFSLFRYISIYVGMRCGAGTLLTFFFYFARCDTRKSLCLVRASS